MSTIDKVSSVFKAYGGFMKKITIILLFIGTFFSFALAQEDQENPIATRIEYYVVSEITAEDGSKEERFSELSKVYRGQVIEYRLIASNQGEITLPEEIVVLAMPIPDGTAYVDGSATPSSDKVLTEFTVDNENFGEQPLMDKIASNEGVEEEVIIDPNRYKSVRWTMLTPFEPNEEITFVYRVKVKR